MPSDKPQLTFSQRNGYEPLPTPLKLDELSKDARNGIYAVIFQMARTSSVIGTLDNNWEATLRDKHIHFDHEPADTFSEICSLAMDAMKKQIFQAPWHKVLGMLEFMLRSPTCPDMLDFCLNEAFEDYRVAWRIDRGDPPTIYPYANEHEGETVRRAFEDLSGDRYAGARKHLAEAGRYLSQPDKDRDCVREAIGAVEAVCRVITGMHKAVLSDALKELSKSVEIHGGFKAALGNLYGYTSDEKGIRPCLSC